MKLNYKRRLCHGNSAAITTQHITIICTCLSIGVYLCTNYKCLSELKCKLGAISSQTFPFPLQLQWWYCYRTSRANPELKLVHLQSWVWVYRLLKKSHQLGCIVALHTHNYTPVGEFIECIPTVKQSISNKFSWETAVALVRNGFSNPAVDIGSDLLNFISLYTRWNKCDDWRPTSQLFCKSNHNRGLHSMLCKVTLVPFANEILLHLWSGVIYTILVTVPSDQVAELCTSQLTKY